MQKVIESIEAQQAQLEQYSAPWCVGEQLKDILRQTPEAAELVAQDLAIEGMGLADCEKKIEAFARKHKSGRVGFCGPADADRIIREFYGIPAASAPGVQEAAPQPQRKTISLLDFM